MSSSLSVTLRRLLVPCGCIIVLLGIGFVVLSLAPTLVAKMLPGQAPQLSATQPPALEPSSQANTPQETIPSPVIPVETPTIVPQHIVDLVEQKLIKVAVSGAGLDSLGLHVENNADTPLRIDIPAGTFFVAEVAMSQNMVVGHSVTLPIGPNEAIDEELNAAYANIHLDEPGSEDSFTIQRTPWQPELSQLLDVIAAEFNGYIIEQAAIWIVTDNASYDDLGILVGGFGIGARQIDEDIATQAMILIEKAGIDLTKLAIWKDRELIASNVSDPTAVDWLRAHGVNVVIRPTQTVELTTPPLPTSTPLATLVLEAGEISQYAASATASSQYSDPNWSAMQAAGPPNTNGRGDTETAWASLDYNTVQWLLLSYTRAVTPTRIVIFQTYNPNAVTMV